MYSILIILDKRITREKMTGWQRGRGAVCKELPADYVAKHALQCPDDAMSLVQLKYRMGDHVFTTSPTAYWLEPNTEYEVWSTEQTNCGDPYIIMCQIGTPRDKPSIFRRIGPYHRCWKSICVREESTPLLKSRL